MTAGWIPYKHTNFGALDLRAKGIRLKGEEKRTGLIRSLREQPRILYH